MFHRQCNRQWSAIVEDTQSSTYLLIFKKSFHSYMFNSYQYFIKFNINKWKDCQLLHHILPRYTRNKKLPLSKESQSSNPPTFSKHPPPFTILQSSLPTKNPIPYPRSNCTVPKDVPKARSWSKRARVIKRASITRVSTCYYRKWLRTVWRDRWKRVGS